MIIIKCRYTLLLLVFPVLIFGQAENIFSDLVLGTSMDIAVEKLGKITENSNFIEVDPPLFPLAKNRESHLVCTGIKTVDGLIENAVFTFADDQLVYIEARGNAVEVFTLSRKDTATTYLDYSFYEKEKLILNKEKDIAWVMNNEGMHLNLFTWENPYLENSIVQAPPATPTRNLPAFIKMGATIDEMKPLIAANSKFISVEELNGDDPNAQIQINGFGVHYMGFPRKIEARFGDNKLNVVWILTGKGEEERVREALTRQFGKPVYLNDEWEIYNNWQVGLRKDKPEVLLMEKQIGLAYKSSYFGQ